MNRDDCEVACAKINLALHVRAREADGYHRIETLFLFARDGDLLTARPAEGLSLEIVGPFAEGLEIDGNLVLRAAERLRQKFGISAGAALTLDKRLPIASGIGGGSADAAAALRLLCRLWGINGAAPEVRAIARALGADVPACLLSRPVRGEGRGDVLAPVPAGRLSGMAMLLVNPGVAVPTGQVFARWDQQDRGSLPHGDPLDVALTARNDLEAAAISVAPVIADVVAMLAARPGSVLARMSGSGATCFALFESEEACDAAAEAVRHAQPGWWVLRTALKIGA